MAICKNIFEDKKQELQWHRHSLYIDNFNDFNTKQIQWTPPFTSLNQTIGVCRGERAKYLKLRFILLCLIATISSMFYLVHVYAKLYFWEKITLHMYFICIKQYFHWICTYWGTETGFPQAQLVGNNLFNVISKLFIFSAFKFFKGTEHGFPKLTIFFNS